MSVDYLIITSLEYDIQQFIERIPSDSNISLAEAEMGGYLIENHDNDYYCWFSPYDHSEDGCSNLMDWHDKEQIDTIFQYFQQPKFFALSAPCREYLYWIIELVANTNEVLIFPDEIILPGSEFVRRTKAGERL